jgi:UDP-2-acetamido-2,6-beta-L-arabino-hexul-4-ose reductase
MSCSNKLNILVTGADGFVGKNLCTKLSEQGDVRIIKYLRGDSDANLEEKLKRADFLVHLAGENRPLSDDLFHLVNEGLTRKISEILSSLGSRIPVIFASSSQANLDNAYGKSKVGAENIFKSLSKKNGNPIAIYRLNGIFGKWCKPNYNSVVATFCHNIANGIPVEISDSTRSVSLVYIDDVIDSFLNKIRCPNDGISECSIETFYDIQLGELAEQITAFDNCRMSLVSERVGVGFSRALYATYVTYLPVEKFHYEIPMHLDERGVFVEMLKTHDTGQFSFFTAKPGITRGGHYHHSKTEKFLVIKGVAEFGFRHILTNDRFSLTASGDKSVVVETVPGWTHDITNIGNEDLIVMLWANEIFDRDKPDTIPCKVQA